jgi:hypothetical protein
LAIARQFRTAAGRSRARPGAAHFECGERAVRGPVGSCAAGANQLSATSSEPRFLRPEPLTCLLWCCKYRLLARGPPIRVNLAPRSGLTDAWPAPPRPAHASLIGNRLASLVPAMTSTDGAGCRLAAPHRNQRRGAGAPGRSLSRWGSAHRLAAKATASQRGHAGRRGHAISSQTMESNSLACISSVRWSTT